MKCSTQMAVRYTLFLCVVLAIKLSYAQHIVSEYVDDIEVNSNLTVTDGKLSIDLTTSYEFNNLNRSSDSILYNDQKRLITEHKGLESNVMTSTISTNLSAGISPTLTTNVSVTNMKRVWRVVGNNSNITTVNVSSQENSSSQNTSLGNYYMFVSNTGVFDSTADYRILWSDGNGNLETEYSFDRTTYITFGYAPRVTFERSIYFDGKDDYIDMDNTLNLNPSGFTISAWVKRDAPNYGTVSIVSKRDDPFTHGYDLRILNNNRIEIIWKNGSDQSLISNSAIPNDEWHHVAAIYNGTEVSIYIDGVFDKAEVKTSPVTTNDSFHIGAAGKDKPNQYFKGNIDEVRIWDIALYEDQLRFIMNQEITENSGQVMGNILPTTITKNDINVIPWSTLAGYYPMSTFTYASTNDASGNGAHGALRNINTIDRQTAPLPYLSIQNGNWDTKSTWTNGNVQYTPGSKSVVDLNITVDWNIVKTSHYVTMDNSSLPTNKEANRKILGLYIDANELVLSGRTNFNEGNGLTISHYLSLTGKIDLEGESQLIQELNSDLDVAPSGILERDQQGTADMYTYNYWSSPVSAIIEGSNNTEYTLNDILRDGTDPSIPKIIDWISSGYDGAATDPIGLADYWIWKFNNYLDEDYSIWQHLRSNGTLSAGEGFTMKGSGTGTILEDQNYVFVGRPNNGDINLDLKAGSHYLLGNPYPSAIDAYQFISDNRSALDNDLEGNNTDSTADIVPKMTGNLYFWQHWGGGSHTLSDYYEGGYGIYNFSGAVAAPSYGTNDQDFATDGTLTKLPGRYIPVGQGFFVIGENTGVLKFNNAQRIFRKEADSNSVFMRSADASISQYNYDAEESDLRMKFRIGFNSINTIHRQLLLTIDSLATPSVDYGFDAILLDDLIDDMYWTIEGDKYTVQGLDVIDENTIISLGVHVSSPGANEIAIDALENVTDNINIYLHDKDADIYHNLRTANYQVQLETGTYLNRFEITFAVLDALTIEEENFNDLKFYYAFNRNKIVILNPKGAKLEHLEVWNIMGQSVYALRDLYQASYNEYEIDNLNAGTYVVQLHTAIGVLTKKIIIK